MKRKLRKLRNILLLSLIVFLTHDIHAQELDSLYRTPQWRAQMIAVDLIRFDSLMSENIKIVKDFKTMQQIAALRLKMIVQLNQIVLEKEVQVRIQQQKVQEAMKFKQIAIKYKRQRNLVIAGVSILAVGGVIRSLKR